METTINKIVRIGMSPEGDVFCRIKTTVLDNLSITGVIGPTRDGNCKGSCGQIIMSDWGIRTYAPGWTPELEAKFREVWEAWHLNDMNAGSPAQRAYLKANPITDRLNYYAKACEALEAAGLNPDPNYLHNGKPYKYGSAWLKERVPEEVLQFLASLPDTDIQPAWC